ncbi:hypothetical protein ECC02_013503 [Trypanosoma cruzi]|uniref:Dispersed gene family protein 1 (DGF-1) n=1 Tax=Trypanosoma cruzi TaxID=5693 RepID=A0A7J6XIA9_TRYCR|nr:hypothetical protein ECC02_013503 [Trypanosoma cruzi]
MARVGVRIVVQNVSLRNGAVLYVMGGGALRGAMLAASFVSGLWLSVRGNSVSGRLLLLPSYPRSAELVQSTLTLHGNAGSGPVVMDGTVALGGAGRRFVVGCLTLNGQALQPMDYRSAGIIGEFRPVACGVCDADVRCFAAATRAMSGSCGCRCAEGGYGRDCLPVYLPHVDGCNRTSVMPLLSCTGMVTEARSLTPTSTPSPSATHYSPTPYGPTGTLRVTEAVALLPTRTPTASVSSTPWWSDVACPTLAVTTAAAGGSLTQNDIRGGGSVVPTLLMVALPPPFRWARDPQLGTHLSFVPVSTAQPSGFGGPWGAMLRNATWERNATNPSTVVELAVPVHRGYSIVADETIVIRCDAAAVSGGCKGVLLGSFTIRLNTLPAAASVLSAITGVAAGAAAVAVVVSGGLGSILEMQALGVFARMPCASAQERASTVALPYFLSVFAALDPLWMVVGNALLAAVFGCVHYGVTAAFQRWRGECVGGDALPEPDVRHGARDASRHLLWLGARTGDARRPRAAPRDRCRWRAVRCGVPCWRVLLDCPPHGRELHEVLAVFEEAAARAPAVPRRVLAPRGAAADVRRHADEHEGQPRVLVRVPAVGAVCGVPDCGCAPARGRLPRPVFLHGGCAACGCGRGCLHEHDALGLFDGDARGELCAPCGAVPGQRGQPPCAERRRCEGVRGYRAAAGRCAACGDCVQCRCVVRGGPPLAGAARAAAWRAGGAAAR